MKRFKKIGALILTFAMLAAFLPQAVMATESTASATESVTLTFAEAVSAGLISVNKTSYTAPSEATIKYQDGTKTFTENVHVFPEYTEVKSIGKIEGYDRIEFYIGMASDAPEDASANVLVSKYKAGRNDDGTVNTSKKLYWTGTNYTFDKTTNGKKLVLDMNGFDSFQFNINANIVLGDFKIIKENSEWDTVAEATTDANAAYNTPLETMYGGISQYIADSNTIWWQGQTYYEYKLRNIKTNTYSAVEFNLGFDARDTSYNKENDYYTAVVMLSTGSAGRVWSNTYTIKRGSDAVKVFLPMTTDVAMLQINVKRYSSDGKTDATTTNKMLISVSGMKFYRTAGVLQSIEHVNLPKSYANLTWSNTEYDIKRSGIDTKAYGFLVSKNKNTTATEDTYGSATHYNAEDAYITGKLVDRFCGTVAIPALDQNTAVQATSEDYLKIYGINYAEGLQYNVKDWGFSITELYSANNMQNGFCEDFDIDVSGYDLVKVESHMPYSVAEDGTTKTNRYVGIFNASMVKNNDDTIDVSYDETAKTITMESQAKRTAGTAAVAIYSVGNDGVSETAFVMDNTALLGDKTQAITGRNNGTYNGTVIAPKVFDIADNTEGASYVNVYYKAETLAETASFAESGFTDADCIGTYMLSSEYTNIDSVETIATKTVQKDAADAAFEALGLPATVTVTAGETEYAGIGVVWSKGSYSAATPGRYTIKGTLNADDLRLRNLTNASNLQAKVIVIVEGPETEPEYIETFSAGVDAMSTGCVNNAVSSIGAKTDAYLKVNGATKAFKNNAYKITATSELKAIGTVTDYDEAKFYIGLSPDSPAGSSIEVGIYKYDAGRDENGNVIMNGSDAATKNLWSGTKFTIDNSADSKQFVLDLNGFDSFQVNIAAKNGATAVLGDFKLVKQEGVEWDTWATATGNANLFHSDPSSSSGSPIGQVMYGNFMQYIKNSLRRWVGVNSQGNYHSESWIGNFEAGKYSAMEFIVGLADSQTTNTTGDYFTITINTATTGGTSTSKYYAYQGMSAQKVIIPLDPTAYRLQVKFDRYHADGTAATSTSGVTGNLVPQISGMKLYKNVSTATSIDMNNWNSFYNATNMGARFPKTVIDNNQYGASHTMLSSMQNHKVILNGMEKTMRGHTISKTAAEGKSVNEDFRSNGLYKYTVNYVTGKVYDRFAGYAAIPQIESNANVPATADDYLKIYGCNYTGTKYNINSTYDKTLLYGAYRMKDNFGEYFDLDISGYDFIRVETQMPYTEEDGAYTYRYVGIYDYATMKYSNPAIESGYNETEKTVWVESPKAREAGSIVAALYGFGETGAEEKAVAVKNDAVLGETTQTVSGKTSADCSVIKTEELDISDKVEGASYVKLYYTENTVAADAANLAATGVTESELLGTYMLSSEYTDIDSVVAIPTVDVKKGVLFEDISLPDTVTVTAGGLEYAGIGVTWAKGSYNETEAGNYTIYGTLNAEDLRLRNLTNDTAIKAQIVVAIEAAEVKKEESIEKDVRLGGGGFVTGIVFHPLDADLAYAKTDVGGAFRYDASEDKWVCITDNLPHENMYGIDAIAVDPNNADVVYITAGMYWYKAGHAIFKSTDRGETWTNISYTSDSRVFSGNSVNRAIGQSFVVDPSNSDVLYCGTRVAGLWKSTDGGESWTQTSLPYETGENGATYNDNCTGVRAVAIDGTTVYAGVYNSPNAQGGVYMSTDGGENWTLLADGPTLPLDIKVYDGDVYVASGRHMCITSDESFVQGSFMMYDTSAGTWVDMTPEGYKCAGSFDVYSNNGTRTIYLSDGMRGGKLYVKSGDGEWSDITSMLTYDTGSLWFKDVNSYVFNQYSYVGDIETHQRNGKVDLWVTCGGVGIWKITDVDSSKKLEAKVNGVEVTSTYGLAVPAAAGFDYELISFNVDYGIIRTADVDNQSSSDNYRTFAGNVWFGKVEDMEIAFNNGNYAAFTFYSNDGIPSVALSTDGGETFAPSDAYSDITSIYAEIGTNVKAGNIAIGAGTNTPNLVAVASADIIEDGAETLSLPVLYSNDFGASWTESDLSGVYSGFDVVDSDKVNGDVFYIYNPTSGNVYTSLDGGASFTQYGSSLLVGAEATIGTSYRPMLKSKPNSEGEVWISNSKGLYKSTNYGQNWEIASEDATVNKVKGFGFGKGLSADTPSIFVLGSVEGTFGLFRSDDNGASWIKINEEISCKISVRGVEGDMNNFGRVYVGASGRGIYYFDTAKFLNVTEESGEYTADIINRKGTQDMTAVSALYVDGILKNVIVGESKSIDNADTLKVAKPAYEGEGTTIERKIFIWDSVSNMNPIFKAVIK